MKRIAVLVIISGILLAAGCGGPFSFVGKTYSGTSRGGAFVKMSFTNGTVTTDVNYGAFTDSRGYAVKDHVLTAYPGRIDLSTDEYSISPDGKSITKTSSTQEPSTIGLYLKLEVKK